MKKSLTYADAGVDIDKADALVDTIKKIAKKTRRMGVMGEIGGFGGLFSLNTANMKSPVLVSSTDGVGTKLKIAFLMNRHDTMGIDLVAMCVNDIAVQGARPLFFLDYLATGKLEPGTVTDIITGVGEGCIQADCALIGGETAEMPGFYRDDEYDLAGFAVGIVDNSKIVDGSEIRPGHQIIGIASKWPAQQRLFVGSQNLFRRVETIGGRSCSGTGKDRGRGADHANPHLLGDHPEPYSGPAHPRPGPYHRRWYYGQHHPGDSTGLRYRHQKRIMGRATHIPVFARSRKRQ